MPRYPGPGWQRAGDNALAIGNEVYMMIEKSIYHLICDSEECRWHRMQKKLKKSAAQAVKMTLPDEYYCRGTFRGVCNKLFKLFCLLPPQGTTLTSHVWVNRYPYHLLSICPAQVNLFDKAPQGESVMALLNIF